MPITQTDWLDSLHVPKRLNSADYEYSGDRKALEAFQSIPGVSWLCSKIISFFLEIEKAGMLGRAVRVTPKQFPEIDRLKAKCAEVLGITPPPMFVFEVPMLNAFTLGPDAENSFVLLTRALADTATEKELMFVIGHEMGHIKSQHSLYHTVAILLANSGVLAARMLQLPGVRYLLILFGPSVELALNAWARRSEITCDRAGLVCCQDVEAARKALLLLGCGSRRLMERIDLDEFQTQRDDLSKSYGKWGELFQTHPYLPRRVKALEVFGDGAFYQGSILRKGNKGKELGSIDNEVAKVLGDLEPVTEGAAAFKDWSKKRLSQGLGAVAKGLDKASKQLDKQAPKSKPKAKRASRPAGKKRKA